MFMIENKNLHKKFNKHAKMYSEVKPKRPRLGFKTSNKILIKSLRN